MSNKNSLSALASAEELRRRRDARPAEHKDFYVITPAELDAVITAVEDVGRLRKTLERIDAVVERMYLPPEFAHFQAELCRLLTLEGRDG